MSRGVEMIEGILKECGYELDEARLSAVNGNGRDDTDSPYRAINDYALKNLEAWAKDLPIHRLQRQRGRYASFTGVAQWRTSTRHGTDLDKRDSNLKICSSGIRDFGDNRGYTPLDLVMAAKGIELKEAFDWLDEKLGWSTGGPEIDVEAVRAKQAEKERVDSEPQSDNSDFEKSGAWAARFQRTRRRLSRGSCKGPFRSLALVSCRGRRAQPRPGCRPI